MQLKLNCYSRPGGGVTGRWNEKTHVFSLQKKSHLAVACILKKKIRIINDWMCRII